MHSTTESDVAAGYLSGLDSLARTALDSALSGRPLSDEHARHVIALPRHQWSALLAVAGRVRTQHKGHVITYSPKVFLPITNLCLDRCAYCTFRKDPDAPDAWTMLPEDVRAASRDGRRLGCVEALMCLGDRPERAFRAYRRTLDVLGHHSTTEYVAACCRIALDEGLLPHTNAGLLSRDELRHLRSVNASLGLMLENVSPRLRCAGEVHHHAPDKDPALRLQTLRDAGELQIPITTGILIGIGETLGERVASLSAIRDLALAYGHIQEVIIQNFRAKPATRMATRSEPDSYDLARTVAVARLMMPDMNIQVPPNLNPYDHRLFLAAGINDWGGISPLTPDYVNPEAPWPHVSALARTCASEGFTLVARLPVYPEYLERPGFLDTAIRERLVGRPAPRGVCYADRAA